MQWCRLYKEFATDPKIQRLSEAIQRRLVMLFCLHIDNEIDKLTDDDVQFILKVTKSELKKTKEVLQKIGLINKSWKLRRWEVRQFASDSSSARVARLREKRKQVCNVTETLQKRDCNALDTDTDTDSSSNILLFNNINPSNPSLSPNPFPSPWNVYYEKLAVAFPHDSKIIPAKASQPVKEMYMRWESVGVIGKDVEVAIQTLEHKQADIGSATFYYDVVVQFRMDRKNNYETAIKKNQKKLSEEDKLNAYLAKVKAESEAAAAEEAKANAH